MKKRYVFWFMSFIFSFIGFYLIENTFTIRPDVISGNGNFGILVIMLFAPIFMMSYYFTFKQVREIFKNSKNRDRSIAILFLFLISCVLLVYPIRYYTTELITALGGTPTNPGSRIYRFGWFNQYTNSIYFNLYTFLLTHILAIIVGILSIMKKY